MCMHKLHKVPSTLYSMHVTNFTRLPNFSLKNLKEPGYEATRKLYMKLYMVIAIGDNGVSELDIAKTGMFQTFISCTQTMCTKKKNQA